MELFGAGRGLLPDLPSSHLKNRVRFPLQHNGENMPAASAKRHTCTDVMARNVALVLGSLVFLHDKRNKA
ncbi:hypothetical protein MRB53_027201 [Persea americana]|uniref:Uncharacterized protein n=1 Tax=Persea americana TaxID=3435 RepID=A0ACC2LKF6_PERAE|nr:hypothetical protein MRB53_027201 [Persea americana]